ncbi:hypothetical protein MAR_021138 [Mya arenaria]|uniref:Uncharacterized protein n=1 Tax=Mya arenaria TaxID=6604 RepID=A0ABY7E9F5_MYAAR|nr:hypothetical protein MAR_021138 [Mya arenaria]
MSSSRNSDVPRRKEHVYEGTDTDNRIDTHSADDPGLNTTQTYEALSMTMDTVAYDELKIGVNGANHLDVLNASSAKPLPYYGNVQTGTD